jgi:hypothetical protein
MFPQGQAHQQGNLPIYNQDNVPPGQINQQGNLVQGQPMPGDQGHQPVQGQGNEGHDRLQHGNQGQQDQTQRNNPEALRKNLRYDGKEHWLGFKHKFLRYVALKG